MALFSANRLIYKAQFVYINLRHSYQTGIHNALFRPLIYLFSQL
jgi:hypothetical protein